MNLCNENHLQTLDDYWRDLERSAYSDVLPLVKTDFRWLFYAGAMSCLTICDNMMNAEIPESESIQRLDALHEELRRFANLGRDEGEAPPPKGEGP